MKPDIVDIVRSTWRSYQLSFAPATEGLMFHDSKVAVPAYVGVKNGIDEETAQRLRSSLISVSYVCPRNTPYWAFNTLRQFDEFKYHGNILVSIDLLERRKEFRKFILAREWLQVIVGLYDPDGRKSVKSFGSRAELVEFYWQLSREYSPRTDNLEMANLERGLQYLLLPDETIIDFIREFYMPFDELIALIGSRDGASTAAAKVRSIERALAESQNVRIDIVQTRLRQLLLNTA